MVLSFQIHNVGLVILVDYLILINCVSAVPLSHPSREKPTRLLPDTQELCKRLEEKIESLTKMGGTLQRENKGYISSHFQLIYQTFLASKWCVFEKMSSEIVKMWGNKNEMKIYSSIAYYIFFQCKHTAEYLIFRLKLKN